MVVVGSGAAGLAAALGAAASGADVVVLESAPSVGGTSAMSGGVVWVPAHGLAGDDVGAGDEPLDALRYLCAAGFGDRDERLMATFVSDAARVVRELAARTPVDWEVLGHWPDYRAELPGGRAGRSLWPRPVTVARAVEAQVQPAPDQPSPPPGTGDAPDDDVVLGGYVRGRALVAALLAGALGAGVEVRTGARARRLITGPSGVAGVEVDGAAVEGRVVLATGGFQHDAAHVATFLPACPIAAMGVRGCAGDGLDMAMSVGAALGNMAEGWWMPAIHVPGEEFEGRPYYRPLRSEAAQPGAVLVDREGRRFVDEAQNYGDVGRAMQRFAGGARPFPAAPCWMVFDAAYRHRYPWGPVGPDDPDPAWLASGADIGKLADATGMPAAALEDTVARFNAAAAAHEDPEFGRGSRPYDRWVGDRTAPHPTLAPLATPPFFALPVELGCMGTKGGPRTDSDGRVLAVTGEPVAGLFAAGNVAAQPFGTATPAGGATLGPALVLGYRAGEAAAGVR